MYRLKQLPEDFVVQEKSTINFQSSGRYLYVKLWKKNHTTMDVVRDLAKRLHVKEKYIGFAGAKDKQAITEQLISLPKVRLEAVKGEIGPHNMGFTLKNVRLEALGSGDIPISLGDLAGNNFKIVVRNLSRTDLQKLHLSSAGSLLVSNYFDEQRFSNHNVSLGRHLVKKEFKEAAALTDEFVAKRHLSEHPTDAIGALKRIPMRLLKMYVHAYQSYLWNETLAVFLERQGTVLKTVPYSQGAFVFVKSFVGNITDAKVPLLGFNPSLIPDMFAGTAELLLKREGLTWNDFVLKQIPELSLEGGLRPAFVEVNNFTISPVENDDLNKGKKKIQLSFFLPKGSYATMVIRALF